MKANVLKMALGAMIAVSAGVSSRPAGADVDGLAMGVLKLFFWDLPKAVVYDAPKHSLCLRNTAPKCKEVKGGTLFDDKKQSDVKNAAYAACMMTVCHDQGDSKYGIYMCKYAVVPSGVGKKDLMYSQYLKASWLGCIAGMCLQNPEVKDVTYGAGDLKCKEVKSANWDVAIPTRVFTDKD
jgi:hypothetical protein